MQDARRLSMVGMIRPREVRLFRAYSRPRTDRIGRAVHLVPSRLALLVAFLLAPVTGHATSSFFEEPTGSSVRFGRMSLGVSGGFQYWTLSSLEDFQDARAALFAADGFNFPASEYGATYAYTVDIQARFGGGWLLRAQAEWSRIGWEDRDRAFLASLDGTGIRTPVSIVYGTDVKTRPLIFGLGLGRESYFRETRLSLTGLGLITPLKTEDEAIVIVGRNSAETTTTWESTGVGWGFEGIGGVDWLPDADMTIFVETFARVGATTVEPVDGSDASSFLPSRRRIETTGFGIRLGVRWI